jgi:uncharacterized protein (DUF58 family)
MAVLRSRHEAEALAARLPPLLVQAERVAATVAQGVHGRRRVGSGDSFWQFRPYVPGDPVARIDWRETAKSERAYVRENEWEAAQSVWLWHDRSPSMDWQSEKNLPTKRDRAALLLLALAALLVRGGERVALVGAGLPPAHGRAVLDRLALTMARAGGTAPGLPPVMPLPRHASIVLIGDFLMPLDETHDLLAGYAASGVRGHLLQVLDPAEESLPYDGRVRFEGMEREGNLILARVEAVREQYQARLAGHQDGLAALARSHGWSLATHRTDRPPHQALLALYGMMSGGLPPGHTAFAMGA